MLVARILSLFLSYSCSICWRSSSAGITWEERGNKHLVIRNTKDRSATPLVNKISKFIWIETFKDIMLARCWTLSRCMDNVICFFIINYTQKTQLSMATYQHGSSNRGRHTLDEPVLIQMVDGLQVILWRTQAHISLKCPASIWKVSFLNILLLTSGMTFSSALHLCFSLSWQMCGDVCR